MTDVVIVPPVPALLPEHAGLVDPVAELRTACLSALGSLAGRSPSRIEVLADSDLGQRVAASLLDAVGFAGTIVAVDPQVATDASAVVVVANGSARRGEKAPGHLDERSFDFDAGIDKALRDGDGTALTAVDAALAVDLLADGISALTALGRLVPAANDVDVLYADDPFGVSYWVVSWR
ncbi:hypothetical protein BJ980_000445 [Nocardioides daedukensis]|uniref:Uncharacterized protein n=1 Tax=Nocardioides daedukensis TaxID=634462 RepID=A0A7Y9UNU4_9ACTN|nr:hypothetical protein [Nocardioides daedukensis]NYG57522.1 hypothetical protein [Nocardioides daedukensis]